MSGNSFRFISSDTKILHSIYLCSLCNGARRKALRLRSLVHQFPLMIGNPKILWFDFDVFAVLCCFLFGTW